MIAPTVQTDRYTLYCGDCLEVMRAMEPNSVDTIVTDPPGGISFMGKHWDSDKGGREQWIAWLADVMRECLRVLKPGGMALVWSIPRTSHWTGTALELAGFEVRDVITHLYGSGFPKSHDISKGIDKAAGEVREEVGANPNNRPNCAGKQTRSMSAPITVQPLTAPATPLAAQWDGWGTALKPAAEFWWLAMKPLDGTFAQNAQRHGVAGLAIDKGRIPTGDGKPAWDYKNGPKGDQYTAGGNYAIHGRQIAPEKAAQYFDGRTERETASPSGRWPANLILDEDAAAALDEMSGETRSPDKPLTGIQKRRHDTGSPGKGELRENVGGNYGDTGGASRFFYVAKASRAEREAGLEGMPLVTAKRTQDGGDDTRGRPTPINRNHHPTVKPLALMRYLVRLTATPTGGVVLDPFMGSGTTGVAAMLEGRDFIGIEREPEYIEIARRRIEHAAAQPRQESLL